MIGYVVFWNEQGDSDYLCEQCFAPVKRNEFTSVFETDMDETDSPIHCSQCYAQLRYRLTDDGVKYVLDRIVRMLVEGIDSEPITNMPAYSGSPRFEPLVDQAIDLRWYGLDYEDTEVLDYFLEHTLYNDEYYNFSD